MNQLPLLIHILFKKHNKCLIKNPVYYNASLKELADLLESYWEIKKTKDKPWNQVALQTHTKQYPKTS
ncbi:MAG: hypothetical protein KDC69_11340, partial [Flavobacteriaceae bacterium]|nr:hypothetical protein [Flavobacteriaceae bacterium]